VGGLDFTAAVLEAVDSREGEAEALQEEVVVGGTDKVQGLDDTDIRK
jgi:hypothetical protein